MVSKWRLVFLSSVRFITSSSLPKSADYLTHAGNTRDDLRCQSVNHITVKVKVKVKVKYYT